MTVLAHCGAHWYYCDGASVAAGLLFLLAIWWSMRRSQRRARERAAARAIERALNELAPNQEGGRAQGPRNDEPERSR